MRRVFLFTIVIFMFYVNAFAESERYEIDLSQEIHQLSPSEWRGYCLNSKQWSYNLNQEGLPAYCFSFECPAQKHPLLTEIYVDEAVEMSSTSLDQIKYIDRITSSEAEISLSDLPGLNGAKLAGFEYDLVHRFTSDKSYYDLLIVPFVNNRFVVKFELEIQFFDSDHYVSGFERISSPVKTVTNSLEGGKPIQSNGYFKSGMSGGFSNDTEYIIITNSEMAQEFKRLALFKRSLGYTCKVKLVEDIEAEQAGIDLQEKIRNYLKTAYNAGADWLLIGGDETIVPVRGLYAANTNQPVPYDYVHASDLYYADLSGEWDVDGDGVWGEPSHDNPDLQPELLVGRMPVRDSQEARIVIDKSIAYESGAVIEGDFIEKALIASSDQMRDWNLGQGQESLIADYFPDNIYVDLNSMAEAPSGIDASPSGPYATEYIELYSEGWNFALVLAHGACEGFVTKSSGYNNWPKTFVWGGEVVNPNYGYLEDLSNYGQAGIFYSVACSQGGFDLDNSPRNSGRCVAETMLILENRGACAFIGNTRYGWVSSSYKLGQDFIDYIYNSDNRLGPANLYSKLNYSHYRDLNYGLNLFGDPSLAVWTEAPQSLAVDRPDNISSGNNSFNVSVNSNGQPVGGAMVTVVSDDENYFLDYTDASGKAVVAFNSSYDSSVVLTVSKPGCIPFADTLETSIVLDADDDADVLPDGFTLYQNYPNPANPTTTISFDLPAPDHVRLSVHNLLGQTVYKSDLGMRESGRHEIELDLSDYSSGVYFYRVKTSTAIRSKKLMLLK